MERYVQGIFMILSLVNPVICGAMFADATAGRPVSEKIADATRVILIVMAILCLAALGGIRLLKAFGISLDAFQVAGGMVLVWMGFLMLRGTYSPTAARKEKDGEASLTPIILFAASPGTITGVITLSVSHSPIGLPLTALVGVAVSLAVTWLAMVIVARSAGERRQGLMHDVVSRFMGLIVLAIGLQFTLTGLKAFLSG
jgi:multiple antibiotic resistance protein